MNAPSRLRGKNQPHDCHFCGRHTGRICDTCRKPCCRDHSRGKPDRNDAAKGGWLCANCDPREDGWEPER